MIVVGLDYIRKYMSLLVFIVSNKKHESNNLGKFFYQYIFVFNL